MTQVRWRRRPRVFYDLRVISSYLVPGWGLLVVLVIMATHLREMAAEPVGGGVLLGTCALAVVVFLVARGLDRRYGYVKVTTDGDQIAVFENSRVLLVITASELREQIRPRGRGFTITGFEGLVFWTGTHTGAKVLRRMAGVG